MSGKPANDHFCFAMRTVQPGLMSPRLTVRLFHAGETIRVRFPASISLSTGNSRLIRTPACN